MRGISITPKGHFTLGKTPNIRRAGLKEIGEAVEEAVGGLVSNVEEGVGNLTGQATQAAGGLTRGVVNTAGDLTGEVTGTAGGLTGGGTETTKKANSNAGDKAKT